MIPKNTIPGTKVCHHKFGEIIIRNISGDAVEAQFSEYGSTIMTFRKFLTLIEE